MDAAGAMAPRKRRVPPGIVVGRELTVGWVPKSLHRILVAVVVAGLVQTMGSLVTSPGADAASTQMAATTAVNVRSGPSTSSTRLGVIYKGDKVTAISSSGGWTKISWNGKTAYVANYNEGSVYIVDVSGVETGGAARRGAIA